eukprot:NODE_4144_length_836_cov_41.588310_g3425_i0.p1 GENE.NODE_4144_length_836_cov_41.588310_g3425_i0~~NODE_4144_length_836_cov_41.588310_g3425_i0.p1  ORF type:complete len:145 (+),score=32.51 NODE_4144_length_836_cov_41.588310_g3425_i0:267-701(+)
MAEPPCCQHFKGFTPLTIGILAFWFAIGSLFVILACALHGDWAALAVLFIYALAPIPLLLFGKFGAPRGSWENPEEESALVLMSQFVTGALGVSGPAMAVVFYRTNTIGLESLCFLLAAVVVFMLEVPFMLWLQKRKAEDDFMA